jgi:hypothetical protein
VTGLSCTVTTQRGLPVAVTVESAPPPAVGPSTLLILEKALIPMLVWSDVPVLREQRQMLSAIERFMLEMALELGTFTAEEFSMIVGLPPHGVAAMALARNLLAARALERAQRGGFSVTEETRTALDSAEVVLRSEGSQDFVCLPETDELVALTDRPWTAEMTRARVRPALSMPVPSGLDAESRAEFIDRHLADDPMLAPGTVAAVRTGEPQMNIGTARSGTDVRFCPVYQATDVRVDADEPPRLTFGLRGRSKEKLVKGELTGAAGLVDLWRDLSGVLADPQVLPLIWAALLSRKRPATPPDGVRLEQVPPSGSTWRLHLPVRGTQTLAARADLRKPYGIRLQSQRATLKVRIDLAPANGDKEAAALFLLDLTATRLNSQPELTVDGAVAQAVAELDGPSELITPEAVRQRMWKLRMYRSVYRLREREDFGYE